MTTPRDASPDSEPNGEAVDGREAASHRAKPRKRGARLGVFVPRVGWSVSRRVGVVSLVGIGLALVTALFTGWLKAGFDWIQTLPQYEVAFSDIQLDPPAPRYVRSGEAGLLERVRRTARLPERLASLRLDLGVFARDFAMGSHWIEQVREVRVEQYPARLVVAVRYRVPTARFGDTTIVLDRHGVVLPNDDLDPSLRAFLPSIRDYRGSVLTPRPGLGLAPANSDDERALRSALALAEFVNERQSARERGTHRVVAIGLENGPAWLSLATEDGYRVSWGEAPGAESPGKPKAARKWEWLGALLGTDPLTPSERERQFVAFTRDGAEIRRDVAAEARVADDRNRPG